MIKLSNEEKQELANEMAKGAREDFTESDGYRNAYDELGNWEDIPEELHYEIYAIHPSDVEKIKKAFPNMIIGG